MATEFISVWDVKLHIKKKSEIRDSDHLVLGSVKYAVPKANTRMELIVADTESGEGETPKGEVKYTTRIFDTCLEMIREMDIKVYKAPLDKSGASLVDPWKKFDEKKAEELEHIENKDYLLYYSFGTFVLNHFAAEVVKGITPGKKFKMVSKN